MKKTNLAIIAIVFALLAISIITIEPTPAKASNNASPSAMSTPRKIQPRKPKSFQEISGIGMELTSRRKQTRRTAQYNPKEIGIDKVRRNKQLGDTATHERRRRPRN